MSVDIRRLEFEDLPDELRIALEPRVKRLGYLGEFFKVAGHQPDALIAFMEFTDAAKGRLPKRVVETIALTVAVATGNTYERNQHERLSVRLGFGRDWVAAVEQLKPSADRIGQEEAAVQAFVTAALASNGRGVDTLLKDVCQVLGPAEAVAVLMVMGRYVTHSLMVNSLGLAPPVPSIFEDGFAG